MLTRHRSAIASVVVVVLAAAWCVSGRPSAADDAASELHDPKFRIVPVVLVQRGETRQLVMSTWCTVGATRGQGLGIAELVEGKPVPTPSSPHRRHFLRDGLHVTIPESQETYAAAQSPEYAAIAARDLNAFVVTITADADAPPGLFDLHLVDDTCAGDCHADLRVIVAE